VVLDNNAEDQLDLSYQKLSIAETCGGREYLSYTQRRKEGRKVTGSVTCGVGKDI
jgi:hypothetical protein